MDLNPSNSSAVRGMLGLASRVAMRRHCNRGEGFPLLSLHPKQAPGWELGRSHEVRGLRCFTREFGLCVSGHGPTGRC